MLQSTLDIAAPGGGKATIKLPSSAARREPLAYVRLVERAIPERGCWRIEGPIHRPGATVGLPAAPRPLLAIELAGKSRVGWGHRRSEFLYILWQWEDGAWRELARTTAASWEWTWVLGPAIRRLLTRAPVEERAARQVASLLEQIERAIGMVDPELRPMVCAGVEERLAAGKAAA